MTSPVLYSVPITYEQPKGRCTDYVSVPPPIHPWLKNKGYGFEMTEVGTFRTITMPLPPQGEFDAWEWDKVVREIHGETD